MIMKIEKISDNQIRCTLTRADLADRQLQLSELAYGTEKAKSLFRDMMQQAAFEFGFEAEDIPLMIEAIPSADSIVLIITKVEDPEELDTRFSKFAPSSIADARKKNTPGKLEGAEGLLDLLGKVQESFEAQAAKSAPDTTSASGDDTEKKDSGNNIRLFSFPVMENVLKPPGFWLRCTTVPILYTRTNRRRCICWHLPGPITPPQISIGSAICCLNTAL